MTNIYRIQAHDSIRCQNICIGFTDSMLKGKSLLESTKLFSPNDYENNYKIILKCFRLLKRWKSYIGLFAVSIENLKNLNIKPLRKNTSSFYYLQ